MKTNGNDKALESYKIFPYVAWIITISFAYFVYDIAMKLKIVADNLETQTVWLQHQSQNFQDADHNFEQPTPKN